MKSGLSAFALIILFAWEAKSQQSLPDPIAEIPVEYLDLVSLDTKDQIFVSNTSGDIYLFDSEGKQINLYSPERQGRLDQLEASWTVNIFSFSADLQEYRIFDRFLNPLAVKGFSQSEITLAKAATLGNNNLVWVWDESDLSLKSLDYLRSLIIQSQPLNLILSNNDLRVSEIREFKNRLFMNIPSEGIFMFDNQGNLIQKISLKIDQKLCFYKEYLFWIQGEYLMAFSLSTQAILKMALLPNQEFEYLQMGQTRMTLIGKNKITLYPLPFWIRNLR
ncbi:hypothetical protein ACFOSV_09435 [Algoriphagus namhaensis]|uniref:Uncharacterized protein n=1 Tax=Algoriphagus namhaensis TaxID=915353 RepID=A0ABV8AQX3_9BACT